MKIIQAISSLGNGGAEKLVVELSNEMAKEHDVSIISFKDVEDWMYPPKKLSNKVKLVSLGKRSGFDFKVLIKLYKILRKEKPDVVHIHLALPLYYFVLLTPFFKKIAFYHTIHSTFSPHKKLFHKLNKLPYYQRVKNICLTQSILDKFSNAFPRMQFYLIENGTEKIHAGNNKFEIIANENSKLFLFVGRLSYAKNIPLLLEVFSDLRLQACHLLIIGTGPEDLLNTVKNAATVSGGRIHFLGPKGNIGHYMKHSDALILTSRYEGLPIVVLEALSMGLPILSTLVGGIPDVITHEKHGLLFPSEEKDDIINTIVRFINMDESTIKTLGENNRRLFNDRFTIEVIAQKHQELYNTRTK
jgi:glycosyltransferase involved in cell wall biosynthesis